MLNCLKINSFLLVLVITMLIVRPPSISLVKAQFGGFPGFFPNIFNNRPINNANVYRPPPIYPVISRPSLSSPSLSPYRIPIPSSPARECRNSGACPKLDHGTTLPPTIRPTTTRPTTIITTTIRYQLTSQAN